MDKDQRQQFASNLELPPEQRQRFFATRLLQPGDFGAGLRPARRHGQAPPHRD